MTAILNQTLTLPQIRYSAPPRFDDLRGGQRLTGSHQIDWAFFLGGQRPHANAIDGRVTQAVFDLPVRTIPDDIKFLGNLPMRNFVRSNVIGLCSGESLADFYEVPRQPPQKMEPDASKHVLYESANEFQTPLWFYVIKEAELERGDGQTPQNPLGKWVVISSVR